MLLDSEKDHNNLKRSAIVGIQGPFHIFWFVLVVQVHSGIVDQHVDTRMILFYGLGETLDACSVRDVELWIFYSDLFRGYFNSQIDTSTGCCV